MDGQFDQVLSMSFLLLLLMLTQGNGFELDKAVGDRRGLGVYKLERYENVRIVALVSGFRAGALEPNLCPSLNGSRSSVSMLATTSRGKSHIFSVLHDINCLEA